jgi:hypothetical protein
MMSADTLQKKEPSVESTDREERILARRARLRERLAKQKARGTAEEAAQAEQERQQQRTREEAARDAERAVVDKALAALDAARREADAGVSAHRIEAEEAEQHRRAEHDRVAQELMQSAEAEREASAPQIAAIRAGWAAIAEGAVADEQHAMIER